MSTYNDDISDKYLEAAKKGLLLGVSFNVAGLSTTADVPKFVVAYVLYQLLNDAVSQPSEDKVDSFDYSGGALPMTDLGPSFY